MKFKASGITFKIASPPTLSLFLLIPTLLILATAWIPAPAWAAAQSEGAQEQPLTDLARAEMALLRGDLDTAVDLLEKAVRGAEREKALYRLGAALLNAEKAEEALSALESLLKEFPGGPYFHKARYLQAKALETLKRYEEASRIFDEEITRLLSKERKEEVAHFYIKYARSLSDPEREWGPQYPKAVELYRHALDLEIPGPLDEDIRLKIADLLHKMENYNEEDQTLTEFKRRYPESNVLDEVDYRLAEARLKMGRLAEARRAFRDFLTDHSSSARVPDAHFGIALTYNVPTPGNDQELTLGIKALEDFLKVAPDDPKAPKVFFFMGSAYFHRGRYDDAVAAFENLIDLFGEKPDVKELAEARFNMGRALLAQRRFTKALSVLGAFLVEHAAHHLWDDAQRLIVDTEFQWCVHLWREKKYDEARNQFQSFCLKHPLDGRTPDAYFALGAMEEEQEDYKAAISDYERLVSKYPNTDKGSEAQFKIGFLLEARLKELEAAIEAYQKVTGSYQDEAKVRMAVMKAKSLSVMIERAYTSAETPKVKITTRNIEKLDFLAYRVDLRDYFMKHNGVDRVENLDIDLIKPDENWESPVEGYQKYAEVSREENLPFKEPGAYILNISDGERSATVLTLVTDLQLILKSGREDMLVFVENMRTRKPFAGVEVLVSDGEKILFEGQTGNDGVFARGDKRLKSAGRLSVLVGSGGSYASNALGLGDIALSQGLTPKAYLFTDRTVYRPGAAVRLKGFVREVEMGRYFIENDSEYNLALLSPGGTEIMQRKIQLDRFGAFDTDITIDSGAPLGDYRFQLKAPTGWSQQVAFPVLKYAQPKAEITIDLDQDVFYPGEKIEGSFKVHYSYGEPVRDKLLRYAYGTGVVMEKPTNDKGEVPFQIDSRDFAETGIYVLSAELPAENASARKTLHFSTTGFDLVAEPSREVILAGEPLTVEVKAKKPGGDPCEAVGELRVIRLLEEKGLVTEREISRLPINITKEKGRAVAKVDLEKGGSYRFRAAARDRFGNLITADCEAFVSGEKDEVKLRIFTDEVAFDAGTSTQVGVHMRCEPNLVLVTCEGERIFEHKVWRLDEGMNKLPLDLKENLAPNFTYAAAVMDGHKLHTAQVDLKVRSSLKITLEPESDEAHPGETVDLAIKVTDRTGKPVEGEVAVALVDAALLARFPDDATPIHEFFFGRERKGRLKTASSCTFAYKARVKTIDQALKDEMERRFHNMLDADALQDLELEGIAGLEDRSAQFNQPQTVANARRAQGGPTSPGPAGPRGTTTGGLGRRRAGGDKQVILGEELKRLESLGYGAGGAFSKNNKEVNAIGGGAGGRFRGRYHGGGGHYKGPSDTVALIAGKKVQFAGTAGFLTGRGRVDFTRTEEIALRKRFMETAYWNPSVVTGADGRATLSVDLPDNITTWKILAKGLNEKTSGGQGEASLKVRKKLFAMLEAPPHLVEGDVCAFRAKVVNGSDKALSTEVVLKLTGATSDGALSRKLTLKPGEDAELVFKAKAGEPGAIEAELTAIAGDIRDSMEHTLDVLPYGVPISTGKSGNAGGSAVVDLSLPGDRAYSHRTMEILLGPTFSDFLLHMATRPGFRCFLPTHVDAADRILVKLYALDYLRRSRRNDLVRSSNLERAIEQGLATLLLAQNSSGAFPWIGRDQESLLATGQALKAMALAHKMGFNVPEKNRLIASAWIKNNQRSLDGVQKIYCIHALSFGEKPDFTELNRFYRTRNKLDNNEAAMLALAFLNGGHKDQAATLVEILLNRGAFTPQAVEEAKGSFKYFAAPWLEDEILTLSHSVLALALTKPGHPDVKKGSEALMKKLAGSWSASQATSSGAAALSEFLSSASLVKADYRLGIAVNGRTIKTLTVEGPSEVETITVPADAIQDGKNQVNFSFEGRGSYTYAVRLTGFTKEIKEMPFNAEHPVYVYRNYRMAPLSYKGKEVPSGFNTVTLRDGEKTWHNDLEELNEGELGVVYLWTRYHKNKNPNHAMVITDTLPAGCYVIESGINGNFSHYELGDGTITFYMYPNRGRAYIHYPIYGDLSGRYRVPPAVARSLHDYNLFTHGEPFELKLNERGAAKSKAYRMTPDELYHLGIWRFDDKDLAGAKELLGDFLTRFAPREQYLVDGATRLFKIAYDQGDDGGLIRYFELLRERAPTLTLSFKETARVAAAYRSTGEHEQALQLLSMIAGASFSRESKVAEALEKQEEFEGAVDYMQKLILTYPDLPTVQTALFGLSQSLMEKAGAPGAKPRIPGKTRVQVILAALEILKNFLITYPLNPVSDEAGYSLISTWLDLEKGEEVAGLCPVFRKRWPDSKLKRSMEYAEAFALFETGKYDGAKELLNRVADRSERGLSPKEKDDRDLARYILGQIEHAGGRIAAALKRYGEVEKKFEDAKEAVAYFTQKRVSLPEVSTFGSKEAVKLDLTYRNVRKVKLSVYKVDLMKLYLVRKSLNNITNINLAGIKPILSREIELGEGKDYKDVKKPLELPLDEKGAYLLVVQGDEASCSGMVLKSDLKLDVQEYTGSGRVRVNVKDAGTGGFEKNVYMKVIGSENQAFQSGYTDLRGIFVAENISGTSAVIAEREGEYAFHRGKLSLQVAPEQQRKRFQQEKLPVQFKGQRQRALQNVIEANREIQQKGTQILDSIYQQADEGVQIK